MVFSVKIQRKSCRAICFQLFTAKPIEQTRRENVSHGLIQTHGRVCGGDRTVHNLDGCNLLLIITWPNVTAVTSCPLHSQSDNHDTPLFSRPISLSARVCFRFLSLGYFPWYRFQHRIPGNIRFKLNLPRSILSPFLLHTHKNRIFFSFLFYVVLSQMTCCFFFRALLLSPLASP